MKQELKQTTIYLPERQKTFLEKKAKECGISRSQYIARLLKGESAQNRPPDEFWDLLESLYGIYGYLNRLGDEDSYIEAAGLKKKILALQRALTLPQEAADGDD